MGDSRLSARFGADTKDFKAGITAINRELRVVESGFRASAAALGDWSKKSDGLEQRIKALTKSIGLQEEKVDALTVQYEEMVKQHGESSVEAQNAEIALNKETETLNKMRGELEDTQDALEDIAETQDDAADSADDMSDSVDDVGASTQETGKKTKLFGGFVIDLVGAIELAAKALSILLGWLKSVGQALLGLGKFAWDAAVTMDDAFDNIQIKTGATGATLDKLKNDFRAVFTSIPVDAQAASDVLATLNQRLGLTGSSLQEVAIPLLELSRLTGGDATTNAELFTRVMGDWGLSSQDAAGALDLLFVASQKTGIGVDTLMERIVQFGSPLRLMGFGIEDSIALFAKWEAEGVNAELVMGSLRIAAGKFARDNIPLQQGLWDTITAIQAETDASKALTMGMDVFGARAGPDMVAAIREGRFSVEDLTKALQDSSGAILGTAEDTADAAEKFQIFKNKAIVAFEPIGMKLFDLATILLDKLEPAFNSLLATLSSPQFMAFADALMNDIVGAVDQALPALQNLITWLKTDAMPAFQSFISDVLPKIIEYLPEIGAKAAEMIPIIAEALPGIIDAIAKIVPYLPQIIGLFAGFTIIIQVINWIKGLVTAFGAVKGAIAAIKVAPWLTGMVTSLKAGLVAISAALGAPIALVALLIAAIALLVYILIRYWDQIKGGAQAFLGGLTLLWGTATEALKQGWQDFLTGLQTQAASAWANVTGGVSAFVGGVQQLWSAFTLMLQTGWANLWAIVGLLAQNVSASIHATLTGWRDTLVALWDELVATIIAAWNQFWLDVQAIAQSIVDGIVAIFSIDWGELGKNIVQGIIDGVTGMAKDLMKAMSDMASNAWKSFSGALKMKSPSTVFRMGGRYSGEGYALGIEDMANRVRRASIRLADVSIDPVKNVQIRQPDASIQPAPISGGPGNTAELQDRNCKVINITINNPALEPASTSIDSSLRKLQFLGVTA